MVSQYTIEGKFIATFNNVMSDSRSTGIANGNIALAAKVHSRTAGGYYWRKGDANKINFKEVQDLVRETKSSFVEKKGEKVLNKI